MEWLPFDLHPEYPPEGIPRGELNARYGDGFHAGVRELIERAGYRYAPPAEVVPNSRKALELTELARERGVHQPVHTRLMQAYWSEGADIGNEEVLVDLAAEGGLDRAEAEAVLADGRYGERVEDSTRSANMHGVNAVPAFVLDDELLILGAQSHELFEQAFTQLETKED